MISRDSLFNISYFLGTRRVVKEAEKNYKRMIKYKNSPKLLLLEKNLFLSF
jgi:hypothetical protein